jgi:hypothetical protein
LLLLLAYYHYHLYLFIIIIILFIYFLFLSSYSLLSQFEIFDLMLSDWVSFLAYPNLFGIKGFVVVVVVVYTLYDVNAKHLFVFTAVRSLL